MSQPDFSDAALVLLGHGSAQDAEAGAPVYQHAAALRARHVFAEVREAFWKQEPQVKQVLAILTAPRVFIVPLFISEGYFSNEIIPQGLGLRSSSRLEIRESNPGNRSSKLFYCRPVGTHPGMRGVLLARAEEVVARFPFPRAPGRVDTTLFIAGHGTTRNENSRAAIEQQVQQLSAAGDYAAVHAVYLEESPRIAECYDLSSTRAIIVIPFFISDGLHTRQDIPLLLGEPAARVEQRLAKGLSTWHNPTERRGKLVWYASPAGTDARVAEIILDRVRQAAEEDPE